MISKKLNKEITLYRSKHVLVKNELNELSEIVKIYYEQKD